MMMSVFYVIKGQGRFILLYDDTCGTVSSHSTFLGFFILYVNGGGGGPNTLLMPFKL